MSYVAEMWKSVAIFIDFDSTIQFVVDDTIHSRYRFVLYNPIH